MRALSLPRPHPWTYTRADCRVLNWPEQITYRGDVVFRAGKRFDKKGVVHIQVQSAEFGLCSGNPDMHPVGVLAFVAEIADCIHIDALRSYAEQSDPMFRFGGEEIDLHRQAVAWADGPWCALLVKIRPLPPMPFKGALGFFDVSDAIVAEALRTA